MPIVLLALAVTALLVLGIAWAIGYERVNPGADPLPVASADDLYAGWDALLGRVAGPDGVDYDALMSDPEPLRRFAATLAVVGPHTRPDLFPDRDHRFAYYINAYNALTLLGVVDHMPIGSIQEVRGPLEPAPGFGFFWALRFRLDGKRVNLYDLENSTLRPRFEDARVHASINCASRSCPTLASHAFRAEALEAQLDGAVQDFVGSDKHVRYDDGTVHLSSIFTWFQADFEARAEALGGPAEVLAFIERSEADPTRRALAARARSEGWTVVFNDYDWSLNRAP